MAVIRLSFFDEEDAGITAVIKRALPAVHHRRDTVRDGGSLASDADYQPDVANS